MERKLLESNPFWGSIGRETSSELESGRGKTPPIPLMSVETSLDLLNALPIREQFKDNADDPRLGFDNLDASGGLAVAIQAWIFHLPRGSIRAKGLLNIFLLLLVVE